MPFAICPFCAAQFHLRLTLEGAERWKQEHSSSIEAGATPRVPCFYCWKNLRELEVVQVLQCPEHAENVTVGEHATVVAILRSASGELAFEVEAVASDGSTKWIHAFSRSQLKAVRLLDQEPR